MVLVLVVLMIVLLMMMLVIRNIDNNTINIPKFIAWAAVQ